MKNKGNTKHGAHGTLTYARWKSMMQRCHNANHRSYPLYGGKGVKVCERWHDFSHFLKDMGECPDQSMTLDRKEGELGYQPGNCRWATRKEQNRNRSSCVLLTHNGITMTATEWARKLGIKPSTLIARLHLGWSPERALTQPVKTRADVANALRMRGLTVSAKLEKAYRPSEIA